MNATELLTIKIENYINKQMDNLEDLNFNSLSRKLKKYILSTAYYFCDYNTTRCADFLGLKRTSLLALFNQLEIETVNKPTEYKYSICPDCGKRVRGNKHDYEIDIAGHKCNINK
jgi:hypothetical protein